MIDETLRLLDRLTKENKEGADRIKTLEAALEPIYRHLMSAVDGFERRRFEDEPPPEDGERADAIYSWALNLTWGDVRRIRAALKQD